MKKDLYHIKQLLSLYHSGMTTLAQEHELMEFFAVTPESALPNDMKADRRMMVLLAADGVCRVPAGLDAQLSAHIDMLERREHRGRRGRSPDGNRECGSLRGHTPYSHGVRGQGLVVVGV